MINLDILSQIHYILTLIFGIALSASFLDAHKQRGGLFKLGLFTVVFSILQQLVYYHFARQDTLEYFLIWADIASIQGPQIRSDLIAIILRLDAGQKIIPILSGEL